MGKSAYKIEETGIKSTENQYQPDNKAKDIFWNPELVFCVFILTGFFYSGGINIVCKFRRNFPAVLLAVTMGICIYPISYIGLNDFFTVLIQVLLGAAVYFIGSRIFRFESFYFLIETVRKGSLGRKKE